MEATKKFIEAPSAETKDALIRAYIAGETDPAEEFAILLLAADSCPSKDFFPGYSGLTHEAVPPKYDIPFIRERLAILDADLEAASTHKFATQGGTDRPEGDLFRAIALEWAIQEFRILCGQWFLSTNKDAERRLVEQILNTLDYMLDYDSVKEFIYPTRKLHFIGGEQTRQKAFDALKKGKIKDYRTEKWTI